MAEAQSQSFRGGSVSGGSGITAGDIHPLTIEYGRGDGTPSQEQYDPLQENQHMSFGSLKFKRGGVNAGSYTPLDGDEEIELGLEIEEVVAPLMIVEKKLTNNGNILTVTGNNAWAEGERTEATAGRAHAEGYMTKASAADAHAEGSNTRASGDASHAEGAGCTASGKASHAGGRGTRMSADGGTSIGKFNSDDTALFVVGNGTDSDNRDDAFKVDANGRTHIKNEAGNLVKVRGAGIATFTVTQTDVNTYVYPNESDVRAAIGNYDTVILELAPLGGGFINYILDHQAVAVGVGTTYTWVREDGSRVITLNGSGSPVVWTWNQSTVPNSKIIYGSLQAAISDNANLKVGDYFETNGFHSAGDGGAGRYYVSNSGTANGKNVIQLAAGKNAYLQYGDWIVPEQLGYQQSYDRDDVVPYITHAISLGCQHIHLRSSGNGAGYTWKSKLTVTSRGFKLTGEGDWGYPNKFTYIVFRPTDATVDAMIDMKARDVVLKDLDIEVTGDYIKDVDGITNTGYDSDENRFWEIDNVRFNSFNNCIKFAGGIKWQNSIKNCLFNSCKIGLQIYESSTLELIVENCLFINCEEYDVLVNGNLFAALFNSCGFGSQGKAIGLTTNSDNYLYQNIKFEGCNFELDNLEITNAPALFIDCFPDPSHPYIRQHVTLSHCHLTVCKVTYPIQDSTNRFFRLAPKTNLLLISNQILGKDESEHPDWVLYPKLLWNETYLPTTGFGGIIECGNNLCGNGNFEYPDALLPFVTRSTQAKSLSASGARSGTEAAIADCNTFIPANCGDLIIGRGSTYESTANMPTTSIFGFLYALGVTEGVNKRVLQMMLASDANIYTRLGRDTGGGWQFDPWKTITAT